MRTLTSLSTTILKVLSCLVCVDFTKDEKHVIHTWCFSSLFPASIKLKASSVKLLKYCRDISTYAITVRNAAFSHWQRPNKIITDRQKEKSRVDRLKAFLWFTNRSSKLTRVWLSTSQSTGHENDNGRMCLIHKRMMAARRKENNESTVVRQQ